MISWVVQNNMATPHVFEIFKNVVKRGVIFS